MGVANLPEMVKPVYVVKKPTFAAAWLPGVFEGGAWRKISQEPGRPVNLRVVPWQR